MPVCSWTHVYSVCAIYVNICRMLQSAKRKLIKSYKIYCNNSKNKWIFIAENFSCQRFFLVCDMYKFLQLSTFSMFWSCCISRSFYTMGMSHCLRHHSHVWNTSSSNRLRQLVATVRGEYPGQSSTRIQHFRLGFWNLTRTISEFRSIAAQWNLIDLLHGVFLDIF